MRHPPYHLRPNKTADRFAFIEAIKRLERLSNDGLKGYTYYGLGGPYLEDFRLLYEYCPDINMVSIERNKETHRRQWFHSPCKTLRLINDDLKSYISGYDPGNIKSVFWLDYTGLEFPCFEDFKALLITVLEDSMIKVTLRCQPGDYWVSGDEELREQKADEFRRNFSSVMPNPSADPPRTWVSFARLIQDMLRVAAQQALPPYATNLTFVPISSFYYSDGTKMFTLTGIVCATARKHRVVRAFADWEFANLEWNGPRLIDIPELSTKERLQLQRLLPSSDNRGSKLRKALGYEIDDGPSKTEAALEQYAAFHRYSPYVLRGVP